MVRVDGEKRAIQMVDDILRGVWLDEGYHTVSFYYFPASIYIGILVGLVCWGMMVVLFLKNTKMQNP